MSLCIICSCRESVTCECCGVDNLCRHCLLTSCYKHLHTNNPQSHSRSSTPVITVIDGAYVALLKEQIEDLKNKNLSLIRIIESMLDEQDENHLRRLVTLTEEDNRDLLNTQLSPLPSDVTPCTRIERENDEEDKVSTWTSPQINCRSVREDNIDGTISPRSLSAPPPVSVPSPALPIPSPSPVPVLNNDTIIETLHIDQAQHDLVKDVQVNKVAIKKSKKKLRTMIPNERLYKPATKK